MKKKTIEKEVKETKRKFQNFLVAWMKKMKKEGSYYYENYRDEFLTDAEIFMNSLVNEGIKLGMKIKKEVER